MSESKQEARLPENLIALIERALGARAMAALVDQQQYREGARIAENELRVALLAALDEARDEALTDAEASIAMMSCGCSLRVRALKSKRGA